MAKKLATSNLPFQGFEGFIRTQNIFFSNPVRAFLENSLFVLWLTLIINLVDPGTFSEILINDSFIMLQKNAFGKKKNLNFMQGFKSAILPKMKNCQKHSFEAL
jgi:hypothetical protein